MEKFLNRAAKHILTKHGNNLSDVTVLMPNHRSCVYFRQALKDISSQTIWSPELLTLQDWIYSKSELALIEPLEQVLELYDFYKAKGGEETLDEFIPTAQVMLSDFNEVDLQLANAKSFFKYLEQLQSMKVYEPGEELSEYSLRYKKFWHLFHELYFGLRERLLMQKKGYAGMIARDVAERIDSIHIDSSKVYLVGFSGLSKSGEKIVDTLLRNSIAEIIWDTDDYYLNDEYQEAGLFFRKYRKELRIDDKSWRNELIATQSRNINIVGVAKNIGQTKVVADILANKLKGDPETEKETAVIVLDEKLLNPLLAAIQDNISALNISMGYPLQESSIAELLKSIFSAHENIERFQAAKRNSLRFYYRDVFDLLHHPYVSYLVPDKKTTNSFIQNIRKYNRMLVGLNELTENFKGSEFEKLFWFTENVKEYLHKLLELVDALRIHFLKLSRSKKKDLSVDIELLFHVNGMLKNLQNILNQNKFELSVPSLRKLIIEEIRSVRIPFDGEPVKGVQVMGMLETQCLDFKNVIILSMNEGIFPSGKSQRTYIPYEMKKEFLTTHQEKDSISAYLFYRLMQRAENVYLLYNTESDELGGGEKSRFILQLQHELKRANPKAIINDLVYSVDPPPVIPDDEIAIAKDETLMKGLVENLSGYGISPSALNTYINCSLQYYLRYVAKLREQDDIEENIEAATLGSAVHSVLESLYSEVLGKEMTIDFIERISKEKSKIDQLLRQSFTERFDEDSLKHGKNYLLYRVCLKLVDEFLKQERSNLKLLDDSGSEMRLLMLEKEMTQPVKVGDHEIKIRGKVDRVEESNGIVSVVDYKTGTPKGSSVAGDDLSLFATDPKYSKAMQLLIYAWLYWRNNSSSDIQLRSGIYWLRQIANGFDSLKIDKNDILGPEVLLRFEEVLKGILCDLLNPGIPFTKAKDIERCKHCEFARICRRG